MTHTLLTMWRARNFPRIDHEVGEHRAERTEAFSEIEWAVGRWI